MVEVGHWVDLVSNNSSASWLDLPETTLALTLLGSPEGDHTSTWILGDGIVKPAAVEEPRIAASVGWKDALAIASGELELAVAYMQGKVKPSGAMDDVLRILECASRPEFRSWLNTVRP